MRLLAPVRPVGVVESFGAEEFAVEDLRLVLYMVLDLRLVCQVVVVLAHGEGFVLDCVLGLGARRWNEVLLVHLAHGLAKLVAHDVAITDLLVDGRVMNQCAFVCH